MTTPSPIPAVSMLTNDASVLLDAIVAKHGGSELLGTLGVEVALQIVRCMGDARRATTAIERVRALEMVTRLTALLPPAVASAESTSDGEGFTSDAAVAVWVAGELSDEDLYRLTDGLREFAPSAGVLADLVDENAALRAQLFDAQCCFSRKDFEGLNGVLMHVPSVDDDGRADLVASLQQRVAALEAEVEGLMAARTGRVYGRRSEQRGAPGASRPGAQDAPAGSPARPGGIRPDDQLPDSCKPLLKPGVSAPV
jgi:hypothetical protein